MIIGLGTDILCVRRIEKLIAEYGDRFLGRWFSPEEIRYCREKLRPAVHFAARMAAKEATSKALRVETDTHLSWKDIEVIRSPQGAPSILLTAQILQRSIELGVATFHLSISHNEDYATATVIAEGEGGCVEAHTEGNSWL